MIRNISKKRAAKDRELRKVEKELDKDPFNQKCFFFPMNAKSEYHHIIPKSDAPGMIALKQNLLPVSREAHDILTFGAMKEIARLPRLNELLDRMKMLDELYYNRFINKLNEYGRSTVLSEQSQKSAF